MKFFRLSFLSFLLTTPLIAKGPSLDELKVAFLYRISKFVQWDTSLENPNGPRLNFCFVNSKEFASMAEKTYRDQVKEIKVLQSPDEIRECHVTYLAPSPDFDISPYLEVSKQHPILTINDDSEFLSKGGILRFFLNEKKQIRFELNLNQAREVGLRFNAQFLRLTKIYGKK